MKREKVRVFEVGPRDGLQNESVSVATEDKCRFIEGLARAGISELEIGAFVRPDRVPQMADTQEIYSRIKDGKLSLGKARAWVLVPNLKGLERALAAGARNIALFTAATESFARRNIGMSIADSLAEFARIVELARSGRGRKLRIRGYVSTAFGCPFEGRVDPRKPLRVMEKLVQLGVDELSVGDTIGVATPDQVTAVLKPALKLFAAAEAGNKVAGHFHDTRGTALANCLRSLELGVRTFDSSAGGLGGCPFAPSATGNLATEDLVYLLHGMGFRTGIDLDALCETSSALLLKLGRNPPGRYLQSWLGRTGLKPGC